MCNGGQYLNTTQFVCAPCPAGTFSSAPRSAASLSVALPMESCTLCPVSLSFSLGSPPYASLWADCGGQAGTFNNGEKASVCELCAAGSYSSSPGRTRACDGCPPGTYGTGVGATNCTLCAPVRYSSRHSRPPVFHKLTILCRGRIRTTTTTAWCTRPNAPPPQRGRTCRGRARRPRR